MSLFTAIAILVALTLIVVYVLHGSLSGDWRIFVSEKTREREREEYYERYNVERQLPTNEFVGLRSEDRKPG